MGDDRSELSFDAPAAWTARRVVVTGSTGFIGRHIGTALRARGADVHEVRGRLDCDLRDASATRSRIGAARPEVVIHLAANPDRPDQLGADETVAMTENLLRALEPFPDCLVIHTGSYKQYGCAPLPFRERTEAHPVTAYGRAKHRSEQLLLAASAAGRLRSVGLRIGPVYGPQQPPDTLIPTLIRHVLRLDDDALVLADRPWDPVHVADVAEAIVRAGERADACGEVINISGGVPYLPAEVLAIVAELAGGDPADRPVRDDPAPLSLASYGAVGRAADLLGWHPSVNLRSGLRTMLDERRRELVTAPVVEAPAEPT